MDAIRTVENTQDQFYGRGTWLPTTTDTLSFTFLNDPTDISGSRDRDVTNARNRSRVQGGNNYHLKYNRLFRGVLVEGSYSRHNGEVSDFAVVPGPRNSIVFRDTDVRTLEDEQLGGFGLDDLDQRDTAGYKGSAVVQVGRHAIHGGVEFMRNTNYRDTRYDGGLYVSLSSALSGLTAGSLIAGRFTNTQFDPTNSSDYSGFIRAIAGLPNRTEFYGLYDGNRDGTITQDELAVSLSFDSTAGNPHGAINYDRQVQTALGSQETRSNGLSLFVQDTFTVTDNLSFNLGVRTERFAHFATDGTNVFTFDWTFAPRLSVSYDPSGSGQQRLSAFYGRYYDPIRNNLTNFAGTLSGSTREEQVYANDQWVTYRVRGGPQQADALFAPTTKTPWTDDFQLSYETDLGQERSFMVLYTRRRTRDIIEDYDLALYAFRDDGTTTYPGPVELPTRCSSASNTSATTPFPNRTSSLRRLPAAGGTIRVWNSRSGSGCGIIGRRWRPTPSATPRGTPTRIRTPTSRATCSGWTRARRTRWGSSPARSRICSSSARRTPGTRASRSAATGAGTPARSPAVRSARRAGTCQCAWTRARSSTSPASRGAGSRRRRSAPSATPRTASSTSGCSTTPASPVTGWSWFADIFNLFDNQDATRNQDLLAGAGGNDFGDGIRFTPPRRMFLGVRLNF